MVIFVCFILVILTGTLCVWDMSKKERAAGLAKAKKEAYEASVSKPTDALLYIFDSIPVENQPFSRSDLEDSLSALDLKYEIKRVETHFGCHERSRHVNFQCCGCLGGGHRSACRMPEYREIYSSLHVVKRAIEEKEKALAKARRAAEVAGRQVDLDRVGQLTQRLREEAGILKEVAQELS